MSTDIATTLKEEKNNIDILILGEMEKYSGIPIFIALTLCQARFQVIEK